MPANHGKGLTSHYVFASLLSFLIPTTTALAATTASPWQGPYLGAYIGGGFGNNHASTNAGTVSSTSYFVTNADINAVNDAGTSTDHPNSLIGGIQAGHDWAYQQIVYGVVADYGALSLHSSNHANNVYPDNSNNYSVSTSMSTNWLFTLRGRLGYQTTLRWPALFYITGGMAITELSVSNSFSDNSSFSGAGGNSTSQNQIGWTAGAGIELIAFSHASVNIEYLYVQMPSVKTTSSIYNTEGGFGIPAQSLTNSFSTTGKFHASLLKIGLNYRFDE